MAYNEVKLTTLKGSHPKAQAHTLDIPFGEADLRDLYKKSFPKDKFSYLKGYSTWFVHSSIVDKVIKIATDEGFDVATATDKAPLDHPAYGREGIVVITAYENEPIRMLSPYNDKYVSLVKKLKGKWNGASWSLPRSKNNFLLLKVLAKKVHKKDPIVIGNPPKK